MSTPVHLFISGHEPFQGRLLALATVLSAILAYLFIIYPLLHGPLSHVPGPWLSKISSFHIAYYELQYSRNTEILKWHQRYGPVVCVSPNEVSVATLEATQKVYSATRGWSKSDYFDNFTGYNQRSVFATKPYSEHREKRKWISAFYQATTIYKLPELEGYIQNRCEAMLNQIKHWSEADVYSLTNWYALDVITYLVFGPNHGTHCVDGPCLERDIIENLNRQQFTSPLRVRFPAIFCHLSPLLARLRPSLSYLEAEEELAEWCCRNMAAAISDPVLSSSRSLLRQLSHIGEREKSQPLTRDLIAAEVLDNINAARATVAVEATYLIWLLSEHPSWQQRVREELNSLPLHADGSTSFSDVNNQAPILEACLREVYRLYPASSGRAERIVPEGGCTLSGIYLPEGSVATNSVLAVHRDESLFPDPDAFDPQRWLIPDGPLLRAREAHLIPFGYGGRICLGKALATIEIKMLISALYLRYETATTGSCTVESMRQCSTHDAVPRAVECVIKFRLLDETKRSD